VIFAEDKQSRYLDSKERIYELSFMKGNHWYEDVKRAIAGSDVVLRSLGNYCTVNNLILADETIS
jgi:hypothetical protein